MLKLLSINGAMVIVGIAILESVFGGWFSSDPLDQLLIPRDVKIEYNVESFAGNWKSVYTRDKNGLRGPYKSLEDIDILTIGGSTTDQRLIDDSQTWQHTIRKKFKESGTDVTIVNAAIDGHSTVGHIKSFGLWLTHLPKFKTKWVLAYIGINDQAVKSDATPSGRLKKTAWTTTTQALKENSALLRLYRVLRGIIRAETYNISHKPRSQNKAFVKFKFNPPKMSAERIQFLKAYGQRIRDLNAKIDGIGAKAIFVSQPFADAFVDENGFVHSRGRQSLKVYYRLAQMNEMLMKTCMELDGICIDLAKELKFEPKDFYDSLHNSPRGTVKIGEFLFNKLRSLKM